MSSLLSKANEGTGKAILASGTIIPQTAGGLHLPGLARGLCLDLCSLCRGLDGLLWSEALA